MRPTNCQKWNSLEMASTETLFELIELMSNYCYCSTPNAGEWTQQYGIR